VAPISGARQRTQPSLSSARPPTAGKQAGKTKETIKIKIQPSCLLLPPALELGAPAVCLRWGCVSPEGTSPGTLGAQTALCRETPTGRHTPAAALPALTANGCFPLH